MDLTVQGRGECLKLPIFGCWFELKLKLTTLKHAFPDAYGLKYRPNTSCSNDVYSFAELKVDEYEEEVLSIPEEPSSYIFHCIYAKAVKNVEQEPIETGQRNDLSRTGSGMFIRVTETEFWGEKCYLDGITAKQSKDLQAMLSLLHPGQIQIMQAGIRNPCVWQVKGMTALQLMSFFKEQYEAKIVAHSSNVQQVPDITRVASGITIWTLESLKI
ncbi:uncharacterized protein LOC136029170 isoform X2 [Artemia franciscana]|uniref:Uncharacterized protein n=2 Tax=Artemia franciscana TaxID=6661 RepID=A0AA88HLZ3_ARTSF|nr:hypothetical protein QYM36_015112 [Artemia franciscana]